jgi:hypothetical protein
MTSGVYVRTKDMKTGKHPPYLRTEAIKQKTRESCKNCPVIHHINGNHFDDRPENRMILTPREHAIIPILQGDICISKKGKNRWQKKEFTSKK